MNPSIHPIVRYGQHSYCVASRKSSGFGAQGLCLERLEDLEPCLPPTLRSLLRFCSLTVVEKVDDLLRAFFLLYCQYNATHLLRRKCGSPSQPCI